MPYLDVRRWNGSLVTSVDQAQLVPGDFSKLENFVYDESGYPTVRGGRRKWNATAIQEGGVNQLVRALYAYRSGWISGRTREGTIAYAGTKLYKSEQDGEWDEILGSLETDLNPTFATMRGWLIICLASAKTPRPYWWDGGAGSARVLRKAPPAHVVASHV